MRPRDPVTNRFMSDAEIAAMNWCAASESVPEILRATPNTRRPTPTRAELAATVDELERNHEDARQRFEAAETELSNLEQQLIVAKEALRVRL